jgi:dynein heavy chain
MNKLLSVMKVSLKSLQAAISGREMMTFELEDTLFRLRNNSVPNLWKSNSYPCLMPLNLWFNDLRNRLAFFKKWIDDVPDVIWLPGLAFPQGIITAVLQIHSRFVFNANSN